MLVDSKGRQLDVSDPLLAELLQQTGAASQAPDKPTNVVVAPAPEQVQPTQPKQPEDQSYDDIGSRPPGWIDPPQMKAMVWAMLTTQCGGVQNEGPRGVGKTSASKEMVRKLRAMGYDCNWYSVQAHGDFTADELRGTRDVESDANGHIHTVVRDTGFSRAVKDSHENQGRIVICQIEEPNMGRTGVLSLLNTLCDGSGDWITFPDGNSYRPTPGMFKLILCLNPGYAGTRDVNQALQGRLLTIHWDYDPELEAKILVAQTGCTGIEAVRIVDLVKALRGRSEALGFDVSIREMRNWALLVRQGGYSWLDAFGLAILNPIGDGPRGRKLHSAAEEAAKTAGIDEW